MPHRGKAKTHRDSEQEPEPMPETETEPKTEPVNVFVQVEKRASGLDEKSLVVERPHVEPEFQIVRLNVGGHVFATTFHTLTKTIENVETNHLFQDIILGLKKPIYDENQLIFIDRSSKYFEYILDYLRSSGTDFEFKLPQKKLILDYLESESQFYRLDGLKQLMRLSQILTADQLKELMVLCGLKKDARFSLLYRASQDGFSCDDFHAKCDGQGHTITIIRANNSFIFGGYTQAKWSSKGGYEFDSNALLFSYTNKNDRSTVLYCSMPECAIECDPKIGLTLNLFQLNINKTKKIS